MTDLFTKIAKAAESQAEWGRLNPDATIGQKMKRSVKSVEDVTGADLKPSIGRILSMSVPVPVESAHALDNAIDEWGDKHLKKRR